MLNYFILHTTDSIYNYIKGSAKIINAQLKTAQAKKKFEEEIRKSLQDGTLSAGEIIEFLNQDPDEDNMGMPSDLIEELITRNKQDILNS